MEELFVFGRFQARPGCENELMAALRGVIERSREEPGCLSIHGFRSTRKPGLFFLHSRWVDEAAFDLHATLPHTTRFIQRAQDLIDHPIDVNRTTLLDECAEPADKRI